MRRALEALNRRSRAASPAALVSLVITSLLLLAYRIDVFRLIHASYSELAHLGFLDFLRVSAKGDAATVLFLSLTTQLLLVATAHNRRAMYSVAVGALALQAIFFSLAANFFGIYEAPFTRQFLGEALEMDFHMSFASFSAEMAPATWTRIGLALVVPALIGEVIIRRDRPRDPVTRESVWALRSSGIVLLMLGLLAVSPSHAAGPNPEVVADLCTNPVLGAITGGPVAAAAAAPVVAAAPPRTKAPFNYRFDTTSRAAKGVRHEGIKGLVPGKKYNVLLYFIESTSALYVGTRMHGKPVTPVLDRLAQTSAVFNKHYANYPLSANAMLNVFMSAYDQNSKKPVVQEHSYIGLTSIPEELKSLGYRTYITSTGMLGYANQDKFLSVRKLDRIEDMPIIKTPPYTEWVGWGLDDRAMIKPTLKFIGEDKTKPFFAALFPVAPHHPYAIPDKSFSMGEIPAELEVRERVRRKYIDSLHYSDFVLGELVEALEKSGAMENTLLFIFADHGEAFYQHEKNYNHPLAIYEENVLVPFLIYNKDLFPERVDYGGVSRHIDIFPTILELVGLPPVPQQEGISLVSAHDEQFALLHTSYKDDLTGVRDGPWKYIIRTPDGREELYDLTKDPLEKTNLAASKPELTALYKDLTVKAREHREAYYQRALRDFPRRIGPDAGVTGSTDAGAAADAGARRSP